MNTTTYLDLIEACRQPGCPVCRLVQQEVARSLANFFYESVNDPAIRLRLRKSLGFCREHAWLAINARIGDALGLAIIYQDVIVNIERDLSGSPDSPVPQKTLHRVLRRASVGLKGRLENALRALSPRQRCPACEQQESSTRMTIEVLLASIDRPDFSKEFQSSEGLCLPHLKQILANSPRQAVFSTLLDTNLHALERFKAELAEFIRKNDYRFSKEEMGPEGDSWKRVAAWVIGADPESMS